MADLSCGMKCLKYLLFVFNFLFWVLGLVVFGVGIWSRIKSKDFDSLLGDNDSIVTAANIMICAGVFVALIGFVGCCGAWRENKVLLIIYAILIILIFVLEIAAGALAYKNKDKVLDELEKHIKQVVEIDYDVPNPTSAQKSLTKALDWFQENVECCGATDADEWVKSAWYNRTTASSNGTVDLVPKSCCKDENKAGCNQGNKDDKPTETLKDSIYVKGCVDKGRTYVKDHLWQIGGVGVGIAMVQILGIVFAILLCRAIGYEKI